MDQSFEACVATSQDIFLCLWKSELGLCNNKYYLMKSHWQVVLSQWSGSNRGGYKIVQSSSRVSVNLDGVFNIISYDIVPKLQDILLASKFRVTVWIQVHLKHFVSKVSSYFSPVLSVCALINNCSILLIIACNGPCKMRT